VLAKIDADLAELRRQRHLLLDVALWYLAPIGVAIALVLTALIAKVPPENRDPVFIAGMAAFQAAVLGFAWVINRRAVRRQIEPRLAELEKLRTHFADHVDSP
jgi:hypothetical protein